MTPSLSVVSADTNSAATFYGDRYRNCELGFIDRAARSDPAPLRRVLAAELT
jgi:hypothetical protein